MASVQIRHTAGTLVDHDRVILFMGNVFATLPYTTAFKIAQGVRVSARRIRQLYHVKETVHEVAEAVNPEIPTYVEGSRSLFRPKTWEVSFTGEDISIKLDGYTLTTHFSNALKLANRLRQTGKLCKRKVGDTSKTWNAAGFLSDAEQNYKL